MAARYDPGVDGNAAGGDFYDAFVLPGGGARPWCWATWPATTCRRRPMGQVRAALRALALADPVRPRCWPGWTGW